MTQTSQTIEVTLSSITETEVNVQQLPFSTDYNGPANMKEYFTVVDSGIIFMFPYINIVLFFSLLFSTSAVLIAKSCRFFVTFAEQPSQNRNT